jgi:Asp-tRNA(Asn)/Glu-tRNA(Gln) amidotransferase A subunit family amidase
MTPPATINDAAQRIRSGELSIPDLLDACLRQIARLEPQLHAWVLLDAAGARRQAEQRAAELAAGRDRGPLHGIPIGIKDIIDVAGWPTRAGSPLRADHVAQHDAPIVARLRAAGAILLGKTVTTEFASFDPPPTRNPWNPQRTPGGSSSGSAVAVATGMCLAAIGSQTGGSITRPASFCGVAGCKPTFGLVSCRGVVPLSPHMDHPGPMARCVDDLALLLQALKPRGWQALLGPNQVDELALALQHLADRQEGEPPPADEPPREHTSAAQPQHPPLHWGTEARRPLRLGLATGFFLDEASPAVRAVTLAAAERLRQRGAEIVSLSLAVDFPRVLTFHRRIMAVEAAETHRETYPARADEYGPHIRQLLDDGHACSVLDYAEALRHRGAVRRAIVDALDAQQIDALLTPATVTTAPGPETTGDPRFNAPWSYTGLPTVNIPCALADDGLPCGLQLVGRPWAERSLLAAAAWCERQLEFAPWLDRQ